MTNDITSVVFTSDQHINSTVGLCTPRVVLDDGGEYRASRTQRWLWDCWTSFWDEVKQLPGRKVGFFNGDLGELDTKRRSTQIITGNKATIQRLVIDTLEPALAVLDAVYVIRGTMAHVGKSSWLEEAIANDITINVPHDGSKSWYHYRGAASGVRIDIAHHANMGGLPWTEKDAAGKIAKIITWRYLVDLKQPAPHLAIRSHNHRYADSGGNYDTFAVCLPCWSAITEFGYRLGKENSRADLGGVWAVCENGQYQYNKRLYKPQEGRRVWTLKV